MIISGGIDTLLITRYFEEYCDITIFHVQQCGSAVILLCAILLQDLQHM